MADLLPPQTQNEEGLDVDLPLHIDSNTMQGSNTESGVCDMNSSDKAKVDAIEHVSSSMMNESQPEEVRAEVISSPTAAELSIDPLLEALDSDEVEEPVMITEGNILAEMEAPVKAMEEATEEERKAASNLAKEEPAKLKKKKKPSPKESLAKNGHIPAQPKKGRTESVSKSFIVATSRASKPQVSSSVKPLSSASTKMEKDTVSKSRQPGEDTIKTKETTPVSSNVSISSGSQRANITVPQPFALATDKRASIVENLGDKEIVKRAFKAFRRSLSAPTTSKAEAAANGTSKAATGSKPLRQENGRHHDENARSKKLPENREQTGPIQNKIESRHVESKQGEGKGRLTSRRANGNDLNAKVTATTFSLKSDERAEKRKEFYMKLEEKLNAKEAEKDQIQAKTKEEMEVQIKKLRQSLNFRATPMPSFYKESAPPKTVIKKIPLTRAKSPKLGRKNTHSEIDLDGGSVQSCKSTSSQELKNNGLSEKHLDRPYKNGEDYQSTDNTSLSKKAHRKASSTKAVSEKQSRCKLPDSMTPETEPIDPAGEETSTFKAAFDGSEENIFTTTQGPSSTDECSGQIANISSVSGQSANISTVDIVATGTARLQPDSLTGTEHKDLPSDILPAPISCRRDDIRTGTAENNGMDKYKTLPHEIYGTEDKVTVQNIGATQKNDTGMLSNGANNTGMLSNGSRPKEKAQPHASSSSNQESKDKVGKPAKRDRHKPAMLSGSVKQEGTETVSLKRAIKGKSGLTTFVADVAVAS